MATSAWRRVAVARRSRIFVVHEGDAAGVNNLEGSVVPAGGAADTVAGDARLVRGRWRCGARRCG
ncbi:MAG: hypothetical protein MZV49_05375 [Rhodopseudomonas palustris]|nr:hypothetical protein [Rhodopseudomonas palustris]